MTLPASTRRSFLAGTGALAATGLRPARAAGALTPLRIGMLHTLSPAPLYLAKQRGYFADQGIDARFVFFEAALPIAAAAVAGDIDVGVTALTGGFFNLAAQGGLKVFAGGLHEERGYEGSALIVSRAAYEGGLTAIDKLPGHSFAITTYGSSFHYMIGRIAERAHFDLKKVQLRPLQSVPNMIAAVRTGQVDATIAIASMAKPIADDGEVRLLAWIGDLLPYQITAVFAPARMFNRHRDLLQGFASAYRKGVDDYAAAFLRHGPEGHMIDDATTDAAVADIRKFVFTSDPDAPMKIRAGVGYYSPHGGLDVADVIHQLNWFEAQGMVKAHVDPDAVIDTSLIPPMPPR